MGKTAIDDVIFNPGAPEGGDPDSLGYGAVYAESTDLGTVVSTGVNEKGEVFSYEKSNND